MRTSPPIAPDHGHEDVYIVMDDFGSLGRAWRETAEAGANRAMLVRNLLDGHYENPARIVAFNTSEGWSRNVTVDIADELRRLRRARRGASVASRIHGNEQPPLRSPYANSSAPPGVNFT